MVGRTASGTNCATSIRKEAKQRVPLVSRARSRGSLLPSSLGRVCECVCGGRWCVYVCVCELCVCMVGIMM